MSEFEKIDVGGQQFIAKTKKIHQKDLTSDCWMVQIWGLAYCSGFGDLNNMCEYLGTEDCGGYRIRKMILSVKYPKNGLPDVCKESR